MKKYFSIVTAALLISGFSLIGCGGGSSNPPIKDGTSQSNSPFVKHFLRKNEKNQGTKLIISFEDGIEIPTSHNYLVFGKGIVNDSDYDALFAQISSKDGSLKSAKYLKFESSDSNKNAEEYKKAITLKYTQNGKEKNNIILLGQSRFNGNSNTNGILVTLLDENGNYKWSKRYAITSGYLMDIGNIVADKDGTFWLVFNGYIPVGHNPNGSPNLAYLGVVMHINAETGEILLAKHIGIDDWDSQYFDITLANGHVYIVGKSHDKNIDSSIKPPYTESDTVLLLELDKDGTLLSANKYIQKNTYVIGEKGDGIIYKNGKFYIAAEVAGVAGEILKIDENSKNVEKAKKLFTNSYGSYYRDFETLGNNLYYSANNIGFYNTDLYSNIKKLAKTDGGWVNGLFTDSNKNIIVLSSKGGGDRISSIVTKITNNLQYCGVNTKIYNPKENAKDLTNDWVRESINPTYNDIPVAMGIDTNGNFKVGEAKNIIAQENMCKTK